jgi:hypothetical protein
MLIAHFMLDQPVMYTLFSLYKIIYINNDHNKVSEILNGRVQLTRKFIRNAMCIIIN